MGVEEEERRRILWSRLMDVLAFWGDGLGSEQ